MIENPLILQPLAQIQIDWLLKKGVAATTIVEPTPIMMSTGVRTKAGLFDPTPEGKKWLVFEEEFDSIFWQPSTGALASDTGRAFALGQENIQNPWLEYLDVFPEPLQWLQQGRKGIVIIKWSQAFDQLRDVAAIAVPEALLLKYRRSMRPQHLPRVGVRLAESKLPVTA